MNLTETAAHINRLAAFCGPRDVPELSWQALRRHFGVDRVNVMALFGGSILCGGDVLAEAMRAGVAEQYVIVGGAGHTTGTLRARMQELFPDIRAESMAEAELFDIYLRRRYGLSADWLETRSTNCGNNITNLLALLDGAGVPCRSVILCQDATMQRRMAAGMRKHRPDAQIVNYAAYRATVAADENGLRYVEAIPGMWAIERYVSLLLGEIPRLTDDAQGYGPRGKGFIAHVDIPEAVAAAFRALKEHYEVRGADERYAG